MYKYTVSGVCSRDVLFDLLDSIVKNVRFNGGAAAIPKGLRG